MYDVIEGEELNTTFGLNVKGITTLSSAIIDGIIAVGPNGTASKFDNVLTYKSVISFLSAGFSDFEDFGQLFIRNAAEVLLRTIDDDITLEYEDRIQINYYARLPLPPSSFFEGTGEYMRNAAIINIIDNDRECIHDE